MKDTKQICRTEKFYKLLRLALGQTQDFSVDLSDDDWMWMYDEAERQTLVGILYNGVKSLSEDKKPPFDVLMQWAYDADNIRRLNEKLNSEAARLTRLFAEQGCKTAILKGQANARLYPDKFCRQPGDIDIWVEGGFEKVSNLLLKMGLVENVEKCGCHIGGHIGSDNIVVEYHFRPSSGVINSITNKRLLCWLENEIMSGTITEQGFIVPSMRFAIIMQLAHIQHHFFTYGIGLRQICDYYFLLNRTTKDERKYAYSLLWRFGLLNMACALMWLLNKKLGLEEDKMLCKPDESRGKMLERKIFEGGNFGHYVNRKENKSCKLRQLFYENRLKSFRMMQFDFREGVWIELSFWKNLIKSIFLSIIQGKSYLGSVRK